MLDLGSFSTNLSSLIGSGLILFMTILWAGYYCFGSVGSHPITTTFWMFAFGSFFAVIPIAVPYFYDKYTIGLTNLLEVLGSVVLMVVVGTVLPYVLLSWTLQKTTPLLVSIYGPVELICTVFMEWGMFGNVLDWRKGLGITGILVGLATITYDNYKIERVHIEEIIDHYDLSEACAITGIVEESEANLFIKEAMPIEIILGSGHHGIVGAISADDIFAINQGDTIMAIKDVEVTRIDKNSVQLGISVEDHHVPEGIPVGFMPPPVATDHTFHISTRVNASALCNLENLSHGISFGEDFLVASENSHLLN